MSNEPTIASMNMTIALFMGWKWLSSDYYKHNSKEPIFKHDAYKPSQMQYHTSWDWLVPVIKKIKGMHMDVLKQAYILDYMKAAGAMNSGLISLDIDKAHKGVYQFLTWYNQQNK